MTGGHKQICANGGYGCGKFIGGGAQNGIGVACSRACALG